MCVSNMSHDVFIDNSPGQGIPIKANVTEVEQAIDDWICQPHNESKSYAFNTFFYIDSVQGIVKVYISYIKYLTSSNQLVLWIEITVTTENGILINNLTTARRLSDVCTYRNDENVVSISKDIYHMQDVSELSRHMSRIRRSKSANIE